MAETEQERLARLLMMPERNPAMPADWAQNAVVSAAKRLGEFIAAPRRAMDQGMTTEQAVPWAADMAMTGAGMGAPAAGAGNIGVFGGRGALTADLDALAKAKRMAGRGVDPTDIWQKSGWFQGRDGKWRFEISDANTKFTPGYFDAPASEVLNHPKLYEAYPDLADLITKRQFKQGSGYYTTPPGEHVMIPTSDFNVPDSARSVMLHELQHAIQAREGFAPGGSPAMFQNISAREHERFPGSASPRELAYETYRRLAGETEARNVQARRDFPDRGEWTPTPWATEDVLPHKQIVPYWDR